MSALDDLLDKLYSDDETSAVEAADALGQLGNKKAVGPLIQTLRSPAADVREAACAALSAIGDSRAVPPLVSLLKDENEDVRGEAFSALITIGQTRADHIPQELLGGADLNSPGAAATQIVWPADLEAIQILYSALDDPDPEVRIGALYGLGQMTLSGAYEAVSERFLTDPDVDVRAAAAFALTDLGERGALEAGQTLVEGWRKGPREDELAVNIMRGVSTLNAHGSFEVLLQGLNHDDERIRQLGLLGLGRSQDSSALPHLVNALQDPHTGVKRMAAASLAQLGDPDAILPLMETIAGESPEVRSSIANALKRLPRDQLEAALDRCAAGTDDSLRASSAYLMGRVEQDRGLAQLLGDPVAVVRKAAAIALGNVGTEADLPVLCRGLDDSDWTVRVACAEGLKRLGKAGAIEPLRARGEDVHPVVRNAVRAALAALTA